jgi:hypothetical protein
MMFDAYNKEYPISRPEIVEGMKAHIYAVTLSNWMAEEFYDKKTPNMANFILHEREVTRLCTEGYIVNKLLPFTPIYIKV